MNLVKVKVLEYLLQHKNKVVSGEKIARSLGISRNSIWKAVQNLRAEGFVIEAVTNLGYRLISEGAVLTKTSVLRQLPQEHPFKIQVEKTIESTNTELKRQAEKGAPEWTVLIAEEQTGGKGRLGRSFYSPPESGLYMSVILRPTFMPQDALYITVAAAVAVSEVIEKISGFETGIKWVNDIYCRGKKVCGILTEASLDFESGSVNYVVLGIGINLAVKEGGFPLEIAEIAGAVFPEEPPEGAKVRLTAEILKRFKALYDELLACKYMTEYQRRSILTDANISVIQGNSKEKGRVIGISNKAELILRLDSGEIKKYSSGEASVDKESLKRMMKKRGGN